MPYRSPLFVCCAVVLMAAAPWRAQSAESAPVQGAFVTPQLVKDLAYGDVLFRFYQDDYFGSLTRLGAAQRLGQLTHQQDEAELLKGALYLSLGQHVEAGRIFRELLDANVAPQVRNRAWFYLGKVWYQRGYLVEAEEALASIDGTLPAPLEGERRLIQAQVLMYQERYDAAVRLLDAWSVEDDSAAYARFNLGVALVREERIEPAALLLEALGAAPVTTQEMAALRDKANLALGFAFLKAGRPADARRVLERVRLQGPHSNKALLGLGWADSSEQRFREALVPWLELQGRDLLDAAVQESYLAVPFAYARLSANRQAADTYVRAIDLFREESARIDQSIAAINAGRLVDAILESDLEGTQGWYWQLVSLPDAPETRYLYHLLASNRFQEGLKNYRDIRSMQRNLEVWRQSLAAFDDMIDTRRRAHAQRAPMLGTVLSEVDLDALEARRDDLESRLAAIDREGDVVGLASAEERARWDRIQAVEAALADADPDSPLTAEQREKTRMLRGIVQWEMSAAFKARQWRARKQLRELDVALRDARRHRVLVEQASVDSPERTEQLAVRVAQLAPGVEQLVVRLDLAASAQSRHLAAVAVAELEAQKSRLASYSMQAQFALASIYDRAVSSVSVDAGVVP